MEVNINHTWSCLVPRSMANLPAKEMAELLQYEGYIQSGTFYIYRDEESVYFVEYGEMFKYNIRHDLRLQYQFYSKYGNEVLIAFYNGEELIFHEDTNSFEWLG